MKLERATTLAPAWERVRRLAQDPPRAARLAWNRVAQAPRRWRRARDVAEYEKVCAALLRRVIPPARAHTLVAFAHAGFPKAGGMQILMGEAVARRGAMPIHLLNARYLPAAPDALRRKLEGCLVRHSRTLTTRGHSTRPPSLGHEWEVSLEQGVCRARGINFAPALLSMLRRNFRRYTIDFSNPRVTAQIDEMMVTADAALGVCLDLQEIAVREGVAVRIVSTEHNYVPGGIFSLFCKEAGRRDGMEFLAFNIAYTRFFKDGLSVVDDYAIQNFTKNGANSHLDVLRDDFEAWLATGPDEAAAVAEARRVVEQNRTRVGDLPPDARALLARVEQHRARGGKVACVFGHLTFDLGGLHDRGPAHADMVDWLNDTVTALGGTDVLVLVKPHVVEATNTGNRRPAQLLADLVGPLPDNVVVLDPTWFNAFQIMPFIDAGLVWRSSVALELTLSGIPAVVSGVEAYYRNAMDLIYPRDREHYHDLLHNLATLAVPEGQARRAALLLRYIPERTFLSLPYFRRGPSGGWIWDEAAVERLLASGDAAIERAADVIMAR